VHYDGAQWSPVRHPAIGSYVDIVGVPGTIMFLSTSKTVDALIVRE